MAGEATFDGTEAQRWLEEILSRSRNPEQLKNVVASFSTIIYRDVMEHFKNEEGPDGPWKAWSKSYTRHMNAIGRGGNKILQFDGRLRQNFRPTQVRKTDKSLTWYNDAKTSTGFPYAQAHNEGGPKLPQREFMWASEKALDHIAAVVWDEVLAGDF